MAHPNLRLSLTAISIALIALTACGGSHKDDAPPVATGAPQAAPAPAETAPTPEMPVPAHTTAATTPPAAKPDHRAVATVNGQPIPGEKVETLYRMNRQMLAQRGRTLTENDEKVLRAQSLQIAVADELFYQDAKKQGVKVTSAQVDEAVQQIKTRVGSEEGYKKFVADSGYSDIDVRKELERNLQTEAYRKNLFAGKHVTEEQAKKFYDENAPKGMFNVPEQVHVQFIVLRTGDTDPAPVRAEAKKRAEEAAKRAAAGEDFTALAKQYSQDPSAERGGDIGFVARGVMFPKFDEIAFALAPGRVSPAFETPRGYGVVKLLEKKPPAKRTYDEVKDTLKQEMGRLLEQDALKSKASELATAATINILDASYMTQATPPQGATPGPVAKKP